MSRRWTLALLLLVGCRERAEPLADVDPGPVPPAFTGGERAYQSFCLGCHGPHGIGTAHGPPLVHRYYVPSHHADEAFRLAIRFGVRPHHWHFGPMPPLTGLDEETVSGIIAYVRCLQRQRGIE